MFSIPLRAWFRSGDYIEHKEVNFINFTGSAIGERIGRLAGMRPIMLGLIGKRCSSCTEDADLEHAAKQIVAGAFSYSGNVTAALNVLLFSKSVAIH